MRVVLFGGSGMIGQGVLRECLLDPEIEAVVSVVRRSTGAKHPKLHEVVHHDFHDLSAIEAELTGIDVCFFALGLTSAGITEETYRQVTYLITLTVAETLLRLNRQLTFIFVSGAGADSSERGKVMWARVKGATENALLRMPFRSVYVFRPAMIQPLHGIRSRTASYRILYAVLTPFMPLLRLLFPGYITTTEQLGRAMIAAAKSGADKRVLESRDIRGVVRV